MALNFVSDNFGFDNLGDDLRVGESNYKSILGSVIFVFVLGDESSSCVEIGFSLSSSSIFGLISLEVSVVFN